MYHRLSKALLTLAALAALALGAGTIASAKTGHKVHKATHTHRTVAHRSQAVSSQTTGTDQQDPAGSENQADQQDPAGSENQAEQPDPGEQAGSEQPGNDGPGGHADEPANPNANHEATGAE